MDYGSLGWPPPFWVRISFYLSYFLFRLCFVLSLAISKDKQNANKKGNMKDKMKRESKKGVAILGFHSPYMLQHLVHLTC